MTQVAFVNYRMASTTAKHHLLGGKVNVTIGAQEQHGLACHGGMPTEILEARQILQLAAIIVGTKLPLES